MKKSICTVLTLFWQAQCSSAMCREAATSGTDHQIATFQNMAKARPLAGLTAATIKRAGLLSVCLYVLAVVGLLALPLAGKAIYHDENALLVGHAESVIRCRLYVDHS